MRVCAPLVRAAGRFGASGFWLLGGVPIALSGRRHGGPRVLYALSASELAAASLADGRRAGRPPTHRRRATAGDSKWALSCAEHAVRARGRPDSVAMRMQTAVVRSYEAARSVALAHGRCAGDRPSHRLPCARSGAARRARASRARRGVALRPVRASAVRSAHRRSVYVWLALCRHRV